MRTQSCASWIALLLLLVPALVQARAWPTLRYQLDVELDPSVAGLRAAGVLHLAPAPAPDAPLHFLLHRDLEPGPARFGTETLALASRQRWRPRDFWARPDYAELGAFAIARQHTLAPPAGGWPAGEIEIELSWEGAVYDSLRPPDVAYGRGFESTTGLIDPRGAFLSGETFWIPWTSDERFTFELRTELPAGWHSMSQGERTSHGTEGSKNVTVWAEHAPQELVYLVAGPYTIREREHAGVALFTYTYENTSDELARTYLDAAGRYLDLYGERFGPYPFTKWAMVENWWQTGFGMPGFTLLGDRVIRLPFIVNTSYGHEILHCWWGNGVYVDYAQGNWCEGLTAYGADYLYKTWESEAAARDYRRNALAGYLDFASGGQRDFALRDFRERSDFGTQAIGYGKSMMVFHMLEDTLGTETYLRCLQEFYRTFQFQPAGWDDLSETFSRVSGRDLRPWFEQFVERVGAVRIALGAIELREGQWQVEIVQEGEPYEVAVRVRIHRPESSIDTLVRLAGPRTVVAVPEGAIAVEVDPDYHLFRLLYREEIPPTFSQALGADSTLVVIGNGTSPAMAEALHSVAIEWAQNQDMRIVHENDLAPAMAHGRSVFLMGDGAWAERALRASEPFGAQPRELLEEAESEGHSLLYCVRDPDDADIAWVVLHAATPEVAAALGRKLPHYSKYSWLQFRGEENHGKGAWTVVDSPLRRTLSAEAGR